MSAFFVARAAIGPALTLVTAEEGPLSPEAAADLGRALWGMNAEAVRWRYDLDTAAPAEHAANLAAVAAYAWTPCNLPLAVLVKSLDCLHTQCCEGPVRLTFLYGRLTALAKRFDASASARRRSTRGQHGGWRWRASGPSSRQRASSSSSPAASATASSR
jgi:hypothetical protein